MNNIFSEFQKMTNLEMVIDQRNAAIASGADAIENDVVGRGLDKELKTSDIRKDFWVAVIESIGKHFQVRKLKKDKQK